MESPEEQQIINNEVETPKQARSLSRSNSFGLPNLFSKAAKISPPETKQEVPSPLYIPDKYSSLQKRIKYDRSLTHKMFMIP